MRPCALLLATVAFAALATPAWADDNVWGEGVEIMSDADMNDHRGGFEVAGINVNFGATITTFVDGIPALTTTLTWTDAGAVIEDTVGSLPQNATSLTAGQLIGIGIDPTSDAAGIIIDDETGATEIVHNVSDGTLQNIIINTASGLDITQAIDVNLELPGFEMVQADLIVERFGIRLADDLQSVIFYDPGG
jgi:hypothetical protein